MTVGATKDTLFTLGGVSFGLSVGWAAISMLVVYRQWRRLGLTPSGRAKVLSGSRPSDPDELFIWRWILSLCCAVLLGVLSVLALVFS
ncbi:MAG TPA: hypothetical protein VK795_08040 [Terriglobales bacterium]|jgi:hypothetical protein|nr:hypothetical protein [Terriglobales bacterium]